MNSKRFTILAFFLLIVGMAFAQNGGTIRGFVYDKDNGEPVLFCNVFLEGTSTGTTTDINGFYNLSNVPEGTYTVVATYIGYDSIGAEVEVGEGRIISQNLLIGENVEVLQTVEVSAKNEAQRSDVQVSMVKLTPKKIKSLPSTGGEPDLAQYLQVLPGVIFTGDQGGQLYIRGGSPIQNKIILDGMTIYNPFHSIGFFSVFETETLRNVDVFTGGFNSTYGGRISAVVDITTRNGNSRRFGGLVSANPFQAKALLEGPIIKLKDNGNSASFLVTAKHSYLNETSKTLYSYVNENGLPFNYTDVYGKLSFNSSTGSRINLFGFNFKDGVSYPEADLGWDSFGAGTNFKLIPGNSKMIIGGAFNFSRYFISLDEEEDSPRQSTISGFNGLLDFTFYGKDSELNYGFEVGGNRTEFIFTNFLGINIDPSQNTTELAGFLKYKYKWKKLIVEPSVRAQFYASLGDISIEPRIGVKLNATDNLRFKFAGGLYSQNLISAVNERDIVNLFVGFLSGPEEQIFKPNSSEKTSHNLQKAIHAIGGVEIGLAKDLDFNIEPYYKNFTQLININRQKLKPQDPDFSTETGKAYGLDLSLGYDRKDLFLWMVYSLGYVNRNDGIQEYPTNFDRRHNVNLLGTYNFGPKRDWEASARWNLGSGFPFTLTQGFYESFDFTDGITTDYLSDNGDIGIEYSEDRNSGRLPYYHRFDVSLKKTVKFSKYTKLEAVMSITNVYNRKNIFYFDRIEYERVDQLPIIPSLGLTFHF